MGIETKYLLGAAILGMIILSSTGIFTGKNETEIARKNAERMAANNLTLQKQMKDYKQMNAELKEQNRVLTNSLNKLTQPPTLTPVPQNSKKEK